MQYRAASGLILAALVYGVVAFSQPRSEGPTPFPFRSADGRITGWKVTIPGGRPLATPAVAEGKVFLGGGFGSHEFYAFDAETGRRLWTYHTSDDGPTAAVVRDGRIAFNTESCELEVITTEGRPLWKKWLGDPLMSMPAIDGETVYMAFPNSRGDGKYYVAGFDLQSGRELWRHRLEAEIITAPVIERSGVYLSTVDGTVMGLARLTGGELWRDKTNATSAPSVWKEHVYFSRRQEVRAEQTEMVAARPVQAASSVRDLRATQQKADYLDYAKRASSKAELASQVLDSAVGFAASKGSAPIAMARVNIGQASVHGIWAYQGSKTFVDHGKLYGSMGNRTQSVEPESGKVIWSRELRSGAADEVLTPPAIVNGKVFVGDSNGVLFVLSAATGEVLWTVHLGDGISFQPAVIGGRVFVATNRGTLYSLKTNDRADDGWAMWGGSPGHNGPIAR